MFELPSIMVIATIFLLAGTIKGVTGLGLATVSLGLLAAVFDLITAMALIVVPSIVTNIWQAVAGGSSLGILLRIWPFLLMATASVWIGAVVLTHVDQTFLSGLLGVVLVTYSVLSLSGIHFTIPEKRQVWAGPILGTVNGILAGMTGSFVVPGIMFLQAIGLSRDTFVQAMGMLFSASAAALAVALQGNNLMTFNLSLASAAAMVPAAAGMVIGQRIRQNLSENRFRQIFFLGILMLGVFVTAKAAFADR